MRFPIAFPSLIANFLTYVHAQGLNVTAIAVVDNLSTFQCWNLHDTPFSAAGAVNYPISDSSGPFIGVLPPKTFIGQAFARQVQYSIFLSGLAHITLPNSTLPKPEAELFMQPGKLGILIAADLKNVSVSGHITDFPGSERTVIAQFPIPGGRIPDHTVLHAGGCVAEDVESL